MALRLEEIDASRTKAELLQNFKDTSTVARAAMCHQTPDVLVTVRTSGYLQLTHLSKGTFKIFLTFLDDIPLEVPIRCLEFSPAAYCVSKDDVPPIVYAVSHSNLLLLASFSTGGITELLAFPSRPSALFCDGDYTICGDASGHVALFRHDHDYIPRTAWERDLKCSAITAVCIHHNVAVIAGADYSVSVLEVGRGEMISSITAEATQTAAIFGLDLPSYCVGVCDTKGAVTVWAPMNDAMHAWVPVTAESTFPIRSASYHNKFLSIGGIDGHLALYDATEPELGLKQLAGFDLGHSIILCNVTDDAQFVVATNCGDVWRWPLADVLPSQEPQGTDVPPEPQRMPPPIPSTHHSASQIQIDEQQQRRQQREEMGEEEPTAQPTPPVPTTSPVPVPSAASAPHDASHTVEVNLEAEEEEEGDAQYAAVADSDDVLPEHQLAPPSHAKPPLPPLSMSHTAQDSDAEVIFCDDFSVQTPRETQTVDSNVQYPDIPSRPASERKQPVVTTSSSHNHNVENPTADSRKNMPPELTKSGGAHRVVEEAQPPPRPAQSEVTLSSVPIEPSSVAGGCDHLPVVTKEPGGQAAVAEIPSGTVGGDYDPLGHGKVAIPGLQAGRRLDPRAARAALDRHEGLQKSQQYLPPHELAAPALQTTTMVEQALAAEYDPKRYEDAHRSEAMALAFQHPIHAANYKQTDVVFNVVGLTSPPTRQEEEEEEEEGLPNEEDSAQRSKKRKPLDEFMDATFVKFARRKDEAYLRMLHQSGPGVENHCCDELLLPRPRACVLFPEYKPRALPPDPLLVPLPLAPTPATF